VIISFRSREFEALTAVWMSMLVLWVVTPSGLVGGYQSFGGTFCLNLQSFQPKRRNPSTRPLGVTAQKTTTDVLKNSAAWSYMYRCP
jgi:hypothetical protein